MSTWGLGLAVTALLVGAGSLHASGADVADAAKARDAVAVKALLKQGADVNAAQGDGMTALHWAATNGDAALTQMLLSAGGNVRATTRLGGITAMLIYREKAVIAVILLTSLVAVTTAGSLTGSLLPLVFKRFGMDPAISSGPFVASMVDVLGLALYLSIAQLLIF